MSSAATSSTRRFLLRATTRTMIRAMWAAAIFVVVFGSLAPPDSFFMKTVDRVPVSDKVEHAGMYLLMAFLPAIHERRGVVVAAALGLVALGVALEFAQSATGRDFEVADMAADAAGVAVGLTLGIAVRLWRRRARRERDALAGKLR